MIEIDQQLLKRLKNIFNFFQYIFPLFKFLVKFVKENSDMHKGIFQARTDLLSSIYFRKQTSQGLCFIFCCCG